MLDAHGRRGELHVAEAADASNPLLRHGPIRVAAGSRHLEHADGTPFLWLADTWWMGLCRNRRYRRWLDLPEPRPSHVVGILVDAWLSNLRHRVSLRARELDASRLIIDEAGGFSGPCSVYLPHSESRKNGVRAPSDGSRWQPPLRGARRTPRCPPLPRIPAARARGLPVIAVLRKPSSHDQAASPGPSQCGDRHRGHDEDCRPAYCLSFPPEGSRQ